MFKKSEVLNLLSKEFKKDFQRLRTHQAAMDGDCHVG